ncbi:lytic murein transglycosylase [Methylovirgula ligni]|uniref:Lytic murein transglycosylase n=2 Tax=Methylovirgula ligni TaxID=569860 RepID=A0A3D9Z4H8_9HYPH|nr:lytic murein transglycosylase [Methylovirgula ligni]
MISATSDCSAGRFRGRGGILMALVVLAALMPAAAPMPAGAAESAFHAFLESLWPRAAARGVSRATFTQTIADITEDPSVPVAVGKQPEFERLLSAYFKEAVSPTRIARGRALAGTYRSELETVVRRYGVPSGILLAAWGMESDFGRDRGNKDVVRSLATLAFHPRDTDIFVNEFVSALVILEQGRLPRGRLIGSWAGAMGDPQFMPSAYLKYAVSYRETGAPDIWNNPADTLASIGHFLRASGWNPALPWGVEVVLPENFAFKTLHADFRDFAAAGVKAANGRALPQGRATLFLPAGASGPAFLLSDNYWVLKAYNNSDSYALSLACLGDRIEGRSGLHRAWPKNQTLFSRSEKLEIQKLLAKLNLYRGTFDGKFGQASRDAIHAFQIEAGDAPADGAARADLLTRLHAAAR